jgi:methionyl-tRNA synthetase
MDQALSILPSDYWRWWLLSHAPETSDAEFTWEAFQQDVNKDLADVLGNFVSRITKFCRAKFGDTVPAGGAYGPQEQALIADLQTRLGRYQTHMDAIEIRKAAAELRAIWAAGNEYLQSAGPWTVFKDDPDHAAAITRLALNLIPFYAGISAPFIPDAATAMAEAMGEAPAWPDSAEAAMAALPPGHPFTVPDVLFAKIADETREAWAAQFAGIRR